MNDQKDLRPALRQEASELLQRLSSSEREALLVKCWMSHDARWFMAVAKEYGIEVANRINQTAARDVGKIEAQRISRALELPPVRTVDQYLVAQELFISVLGPDLLDYRSVKVSDDVFRIEVERCFASDNAARAGIADQYECGIFARVGGWLDSLGLAHEMTPALGKCLKAQGRDCVYTITLAKTSSTS